jgi:phosphoribosyl 1,2-cyclic phosphate phosphodiesterase
LAAVFLTHTHDDHMRGLFALRWTKQLALPVYHPQSADGGELFRKPRQLVFQSMASMAEVVFGGALAVKALPLNHGVPTQGYLVRDGASSAAVLLDTSGVPQQTLDHLTGHRPDLLVIDSTFAPGGMASETHNGVDEALHIIKEVNPRRAVLTHLSHDNWTYHDLVRYVYEQDRARSVVAYDGLRVKL